ncbi:hypothetical protein RDV89_13300 [Nocardioides zeae]|uniref:ARB-07466-like C-terminal domain-containing protein n=1 Tax=Nocardioides imazamoxiresistens TaxID=3231893 RepID=A0ABU3PXT6_9ACTN|nr:hypothetical protein [Nocardioides zeae]MDT9594053.1 hypothetical protein [Nocardioides zeae]
MRARRALTVLVVTGLVAGVVVVAGVWVVRSVQDLLPGARGCVASVEDLEVELTLEQAENASLIAAVGMERGLPARAVTIALATAYQESKIRNLSYGDRDSVGIFQQRPSQGWGTVDELQDPYYATAAFYDALVDVEGYADMPVTVAAQAVQRSAYPDAYADHEADARVLASALTGWSQAAFTCNVDGDPRDEADAAADEASVAETGLTVRAATLRTELAAAYGELSLGGFAPGGVDSGHSANSAHYDGRAIDVFTRPVTDETQRLGWSVAQYLVAHAERLDVATVIYDGQIWTARRSGQGWRTYDIDTSDVDAATAAILEHRDHVHVDVH